MRSSSPVSRAAAAIRWRSHAVSAAPPICSAVAVACRSWATWRRSVRSRSPSLVASTRPGSSSARVIVSISAATPLVRSTRAQRCRRRWTSSHCCSPASATRSAVQPRNGVSAAERARVGRGGSLDRLEHAQPVARRDGAEDAAGAVDDGLDVGFGQRVAHERRVAVRAHEHRDVAGADRLASRRGVARPDLDPRGGGQQVRPDQPRDPARCARAPTAHSRSRRPWRRDRRLVAVHDPDSDRGGFRRAGQPRRLVGRRCADFAIDDALVAERRAAEQRVVGVDQPLVAAPVDLERRSCAGCGRGGEVGVDVGAAEGVDRLLGVADEDQRDAAAAERAAHDVPLHGVGVLELVDEHDAVAVRSRSAAASPPGPFSVSSRRVSRSS